MAKRTTKAKVVNGRRVTPKTEMPASQRVEAPQCELCHSEDTFVSTTRGKVRYCKCRGCGWTFPFAAEVAKRVNSVQESQDVADPVDEMETRQL